MSSVTSPGRRAWLRQETVLAAVIVLEWLYFNSSSPRFAILENQFDILRHSVEIGLLALVMTPVILTGGIDLSVGSLVALSAVVFGKLWRDAGLPVPAAAGLTLAEIGSVLNVTESRVSQIHTKAVLHLRETLRITPGDAAAYYRLGSALAGQGKIEEAAQELRQALRLRPNYPEALTKLQELQH